MRILIVEDEPKIAGFIKKGWKRKTGTPWLLMTV